MRAARSARYEATWSPAPADPVRRVIALGVVAPIVVALVAPAYWEVGLRSGLAVIGVGVAWALSRRVWTVSAVPCELAPVRHDRTATGWPAGADRMRHMLELAVPRGQPDRIDRARGLRRACRAIAAERLQARHGVDLDREDHRDAARRLLGADLCEFLEGGPMIDHERLVDTLERL
jgi:hypothetical protein